jgi:hypothetical protein
MAEYKRQIEQLTKRIAAERQRIRSQARRQAPQRNAQNILAAQRRGPAAMRIGSRASVTSK